VKIPEEAKNVFSGIIFDVYQWEQRMFDGSTLTFERAKRANSIAVIAVVDDKMVLIDERQPDWERPVRGIPAGKVDKGETPLDAAKRELLEETGLVSDDWELLYEEDPLTKLQWTISCFIARSCRNVQEPQHESGEQITIATVSFDAFVREVSEKEFRERELTTLLLRMRLENTLDAFKKKLWP